MIRILFWATAATVCRIAGMVAGIVSFRWASWWLVRMFDCEERQQ